MMCGVSAARAIASPRFASRTCPSPPTIQMPAWVAWRAGRGKGAAIPTTLPPAEQKRNEFGPRIPPLCRIDLEGLALRGGAQALEALAGWQARRRADNLRDRLWAVRPAAHRH